jgi:hypothetical protein
MVTNGIYNKLSGRRLPRLSVIVLHIAALALLCSAQSGLNPRSGSLPKDEPQAIYHSDTADSWNRIFYCLFTRTVKTHLSQDFSEGAPFTSARMIGPRVSAMRWSCFDGHLSVLENKRQDHEKETIRTESKFRTIESPSSQI